jgi:hypothetical protein
VRLRLSRSGQGGSGSRRICCGCPIVVEGGWVEVRTIPGLKDETRGTPSSGKLTSIRPGPPARRELQRKYRGLSMRCPRRAA